MATRTNPLGWPRWAWWGLMALAAVQGLIGLAAGLFDLAQSTGLADIVEPMVNPGTLALAGAQLLVWTAIGGLLTVRGQTNAAAVMLGMILLELVGQGVGILTFLPPAALQILTWMSATPGLVMIGYFWPLFSLEISGGARSTRQSWLVRAVAMAFALLNAIVYTGALPPSWLNILLIVLQQFSGYAIMAINYRHANGVNRNRIKLISAAFFIFLLATIGNNFSNYLSSVGIVPLTQLAFAFAVQAVGATGIMLLAYAVLRQKLFDFSFAINRTLVYAVVSFILLAAFGLAEWGAEKLLPEEWHQAGPLYSAGIALALFLSFHRLRDWVERHVERLLFHSWHQNEAELKRFVASAAHYGQAPALCREFAAEAGRFAQGAGAALYLREEDGTYSLRAGSLADAPDTCADEDRVLALMRAERAPVDMIRARSALPGALALPMLDQLGLAGFMLLAPRPDGAHYRPDEIGNLGWAAQQVGLDLQALQARELRAEVAALREQLVRRSERKRRAPALAAVASGGQA